MRSTKFILNPIDWNLKIYSESTAHIKDISIITGSVDCFTESKGHLDWGTTIIWGSDFSDF